jgi:hypothetical protein
MKKVLVILMVVILLMVLATPAFAHIPVPEQSKNLAPAVAAGGLHKACGNTSGIANHVLLYRVGPGPH